MANLSTYVLNKLLDHYMGDTAFTKPTTFLALFTTNPTMPAGTGGVEVTGGSYARVALATLLGAASAGSKSNSAVINFVTATAAWGTVTGVGVYDALTVGNLLEAGALAVNKTVGTGDTFSMPIGNLVAALS